MSVFTLTQKLRASKPEPSPALAQLVISESLSSLRPEQP